MRRWATGTRGDRGLAAVPGREAEFRASLARAVEYAHALDCDLVHVMAGVVGPGGDYAEAERVYVEQPAPRGRVPSAARRARGDRADQPQARRAAGRAVATPPRACTAISSTTASTRAASSSRWAATICSCIWTSTTCRCWRGIWPRRCARNIDLLRHVQIAGVPGRHEPSVGEINYPYLFDAARRAGLRRLGRVRVPPSQRHPGRAGLGGALRHRTLT